MITYQEFQQALRQTGRYETAATARPAELRISPLNSIRYASTIIGIVCRCSFKHLFGAFDYEEWARTCMASVAFAEKLGGVVTFEGFEQRAAYDGPVVYVSNHMSTLETMVFPTTLLAFGRLAIILKKSLTEIPLVGKAALHVGCIPVTRKNAREDLKTVLEVGSQRLADGHSVLLFPQGTRQAVFDGKKFNTLGSKLAERAGVPVVPLAVKTDFLKTGKWIKDFGEVDPNKPIRFACGPVLPATLGARATHDQSVAFIASKLTEWGLPVV
ncbi:MAG TPA: lysophospholipid acyltransferase family protein [Kiritimatiellia bacterium]|nr:lysophospholipid acyltransferase family protein [Kiritimatiellia bacterium]HRU71421.1 lysophospholipid acyltransferase family protein [Kiritimatiellia bacterium]